MYSLQAVLFKTRGGGGGGEIFILEVRAMVAAYQAGKDSITRIP